MKVLIVSGIWPPEVGGPASHGPEFGRYLVGRGHDVRAVTTTGKAGATDPGFPLKAVRKDRPRPVRIPAAAVSVIAAARGADVIYATGMYGRSVLGSIVTRVPLVLKLAQDPAYYRAHRLGLFSGTLQEFQTSNETRSVRYLKRLRDLSVGRASHVVIPSRFLADIARGWGLEETKVSVVANPAPPIDDSTPRMELRAQLGLRRPTFVFAGRLVPEKNLPLAIEALAGVPEATLVLIGDGPDRGRLSRIASDSGLGDRVVLKGALPRAEAIQWLRAADAAVLPSDWENFPHMAVEALAAGTPVLATSVGGVPEIVQSGVNGVLVQPGDRDALAVAMASIAEGGALEQALRDGARLGGGKYGADPIFETLEAKLLAVGTR